MTATGTLPHRRMFVAGNWIDATSGDTLTSVDPATEQPLATVPDAGPSDMDTAVAAATEAAAEWAALPWPRRAAVLRELANRIEADAERLAHLDVDDSGNPLAGMRYDARTAPGELRYYAGIAGETKGDTIPADRETLSYTERSPYGVVGRIIPFNHPFKFAAGKIAAPLAAGNAVVLKPSEQAPLSALELARYAEDLLPPGVLSVITGSGTTAGAALVAHPDVPRVAFTGSVPTGRSIYRDAAEQIKHISLELGGKNPIVVCPDVDVERAARAAVAGMNLARCSGQSCGSTSRLFVHADIHRPFRDALIRAVAELRVGDPRDETTDIGPLAFRTHHERVLSYIDSGIREGATLLTGGGRPAGIERGYFVAPTVFTDVTDDMAIAREEIFGPVMSIFSWREVDEVVRRANATPYGLTANVWARDVSRALGMARAIDAGYVYVNGTGKRPVGTPFGGWKSSGLGKENSIQELLSYTREKTVTVTLS